MVIIRRYGKGWDKTKKSTFNRAFNTLDIQQVFSRTVQYICGKERNPYFEGINRYIMSKVPETVSNSNKMQETRKRSIPTNKASPRSIQRSYRRTRYMKYLRCKSNRNSPYKGCRGWLRLRTVYVPCTPHFQQGTTLYHTNHLRYHDTESQPLLVL